MPRRRIGWQNLREFAAVDLTKSFVLSWRLQRETLVVDIDLCLEPEHPFYEEPRPAEKVCIRPAAIEFPWCEEVSVDGLPVDDIVENTGKIGHGSIRDLTVTSDGRYAISGEFGTVAVTAERPILRLKSP